MKTILIALVASIGLMVKTTTPILTGTDNYNYTSNELKFQLTIPMELKPKLIIEETENSVVFKYENPNYQADVYLFSINKVSENVWLQVKQNVNEGRILANTNGYIIYSEITRETTLRGKNKVEFEQMLSQVKELVNTFKKL